MNVSIEKQNDIIASLSANAPNFVIRDCIRKYNPLSTRTQYQKCFEVSVTKTYSLISTMDSLGINSNENLINDQLASTLLCRIQTLLPDTCGFCKQDYTVGPNETPLLTCRYCCPGSPDECVRNYIKNDTGQDLLAKEEISREEGQKVINTVINPHNILGMYYISVTYANVPDYPIISHTRPRKLLPRTR